VAAKPVVLDTGLSPDSFVAVLLLLQRGDADVRAVTVSGTGESHPGPGVRNARGLAALAGKPDIPIAGGRPTPLAGNRSFPWVLRWLMDHRMFLRLPENSSPPPQQTAVQLLTSAIQTSADKVTLISVGGLTNMAEAFLEQPALVSRVEMLYIMGGAVDAPGNLRDIAPLTRNRAAECNMYVDPHAAALALNSGVPITLVPLDATSQNPVTPEFVARLKADRRTPAAEFAYQLLSRFTHLAPRNSFFLRDPMTVTVALDNSLGSFQQRMLRIVEEEGPQNARTLDDPAGRSVRVCKHIDRERFEQVVLDGLNGRLASP
jgi:inosine-uridine nucleoside N-ribohydrolase